MSETNAPWLRYLAGLLSTLLAVVGLMALGGPTAYGEVSASAGAAQSTIIVTYGYDVTQIALASPGSDGARTEGPNRMEDAHAPAVAIGVDRGATTPSVLAYTPSGLADAAAQLALPRGGANLSQQRLDHIIARHWHGSQTANAGRFASGTTGRGLTSMIDDTVRGGTFRPNTAGRPGTIFEHDLGRTIGRNAAGNSTSRLRVVVDPSGNVITAFPY